MSFSNSQLKPLDLSGSGHPARSHLLPTDLSGVLTHGHGRRGRAASPLIHPDRPGRPARPNSAHDEQLIDQTRKWVAQTFFGTMLKQMRNSPFKSPMFEGGRGGQAFGEMYDQRLAEHMSRGAGNKLVGAIVRKIVNKEESATKAKAAYARQSKLGPKPAAAPSHGGADSGPKSDARPFPHKKSSPAPADVNPFQKVRVHVATGL